MFESKDDKSLIVLNVVQFFAIIIMAYFLIDRNSQIDELTQTVDTQSQEILAKKSELLDIKEDLEKIRRDRERLGLKNDSLDAQIAQINEYVAKLEKNNKINLSEIRKLNTAIADLKKDVEVKEAEITKLKDENKQLAQNVDSLSKENTNLSQNIDELSEVKETLEKDLKWASVLSAESIKVEGLKDNGKTFSSQPYPAGKLSQIRVSFSLADNKAAEHDTKKIYVRMITPSGECFSDSKNGGGTAQDHEGNDFTYTMSKELEFDNSKQWMSFVMLKGFNYVPGNYIIQVYCEGYDIGQSSFIVKK